jgi:hypothetical protein
MNRSQFIELVRRNYYNGIPSSDAELTPEEVDLYVDAAIGRAITINYREAIELDGVETIGDTFYSTFKGFTIAKDNDTGYYYFDLPQAPLASKRGYNISTLTFPVNSGLAKAPIQISVKELDYMDQLPMPPSKVFFWPEGKRLYMKSYINLVGKSPIVRMVSPKIDDIPEDYIPAAMDWIMSQLRVKKQTPQDFSNDNIDKA